MSNASTHPSLLERVRNADDSEGWREFDARYRDLVLGYCRARGVQEADAEDVRQLVFLSLFQSLPNFEYRPEIGRFRDYLRKVVRNAITRLLSCPIEERRALSEGMEELSDGREDEQDDAWDRSWMQHHFRLAMKSAQVSFESRSLEILDALSAGEDVSDLAHRFHVTTYAIYKVKHRMRDFLKLRISEQIQHEELPMRDFLRLRTSEPIQHEELPEQPGG